MKRLLSHISSVTLAAGFVIVYMFGGHEWLDALLPINGKPLVSFMLVSLVALYELTAFRQMEMIKDLLDLKVDQQVLGLRSEVDLAYLRFELSHEEIISNEDTIRQIDSLCDRCSALGVNSYTQGRIAALKSKVHRK